MKKIEPKDYETRPDEIWALDLDSGDQIVVGGWNELDRWSAGRSNMRYGSHSLYHDKIKRWKQQNLVKEEKLSRQTDLVNPSYVRALEKRIEELEDQIRTLNNNIVGLNSTLRIVFPEYKKFMDGEK